jgi:hypothetical protein
MADLDEMPTIGIKGPRIAGPAARLTTKAQRIVDVISLAAHPCVSKRGGYSRPSAELSLVEGDREALERELLWNITLDGDRARRE